MRKFLMVALLLMATGVTGFASAQDFLPPEQAFRLALEPMRDDALTLRWTIADGYYLYRDQIAISPAPGSEISLGQVELPDGVVQDDPYFGRTELYYHSLSARVPVQASGALPERFDIQVTYQGCAEDGICYPPQTQTLTVTPTGFSMAAGADGGSTAGTAASEQDRLAALLAESSLVWVLAAFFGAGLLLTFTPCVLPMLPILSSIIVGAEGRGRSRGFVLSLVYVLPMALAYAVMGAAAGLAGANLQAYLQSPWVLGPFAVLFVLLAMAMFGFYELRLPSALQTRLSEASGRLPGGQLVGVAVMGLLSALIVGPCMTAPLAGALLYIGHSGDALIGGLALFALGLGMGVPLLVVGTIGGQVLPKAGAWMSKVQAIFGFVLLGVAVWLLERVLPAPVTVALWGLLLVAVAVALGAFEPLGTTAGAVRRLGKVMGLAAGVWSVALLVGAAAGAEDPLRPLAFLGERAVATQPAGESYVPLVGLEAVQTQLEQARASGQPVVIDFYADWCIACKVMEKKVFGDPVVAEAMQGVLRLRPDVTANTATDRALLAEYQVPGPPTLMFLPANGVERRDLRVVGEIGADTFLDLLNDMLGES